MSALVRASLLDRLVAAVSPQAGIERLKARALYTYLSGGYTGARTDRRATKDWNPAAQGADADTIGDLPTLRARSADLIRNNGIAAGAVKTVCTKTIGTGLEPYPKVDAYTLGLAPDEAADWNRRMKRIFRAVSRSTALDVRGKHTFFELQHQALHSVLERGDILCVRRANPKRDALITTCVQLVEADRVSNPMGLPDRPGLVAGVETDSNGVVQRYHVANRHPGEYFAAEAPRWAKVPAFGEYSWLRQAWDLGWKVRPDQTRGVPLLAMAIEPIKQIDRYGDAELMAAVISAMFTVFVKSEVDPLGGVSTGTDGTTGKPNAPQYTLGPGAIGRLLPGEDIVIADMKRPNAQFAPFVQAWAEQIGVGIEIPVEILLKRFQASYSAAKGAQLEAWEPLWVRREWMAADFCHPIYEAVVAEAVAREWIEAPGFFDDPWVRQAYCQAKWVGPAPGHLDPRAEVQAAADRVREGFSTLEEETFALTGGDWEENHEQQVRERQARRRDGLDVAVVPASEQPQILSPQQRDEQDQAEVQGLVRESLGLLSQARDASRDVQRTAAAVERAADRVAKTPAPAITVAPPAVHLAVTVPPVAAGGTRTMTLTRDAEGRTTGAVVTEQGVA